MTSRSAPARLAAMLAVALVLSACAGEDPDVGAGTQPTDAAASEPVVGATAGAPTEAGGSSTEDPSPAAEGSEAPDATEPPDDEVGTGDGVLRIGYVLPETGPIAFLGPPTIAGLRLAIEESNEAGGVLGHDVELLPGDEAGDPDLAGDAVNRHIAEGADVIVGAGASGISLAIIDRITGAGILQCSGSNTSASFTDYDDDGRYFRTVASNVLQGPVLAERVVADGASTVGVIYRQDDYGVSLADATIAAAEQAGATVVAEAAYDPAATTFDAEVRQVLDGEPDAVVLIAFDEGARILRTLLEAGRQPTEIYGTDGMPLPDLPSLVDEANPAILSGLTATGASSGFDDDFIERLEQANPDLDTTLFAPHYYDCGAVFVLAAIAAGSDEPAVIRDAIVDVTRDGTECRTIPDCIELLGAGEDIDYTGASGPLDMSDDGEPSVAIYDILSLDDDGAVQTLDTVEVRAQ